MLYVRRKMLLMHKYNKMCKTGYIVIITKLLRRKFKHCCTLSIYSKHWTHYIIFKCYLILANIITSYIDLLNIFGFYDSMSVLNKRIVLGRIFETTDCSSSTYLANDCGLNSPIKDNSKKVEQQTLLCNCFAVINRVWIILNI